jgi:hypothetical protein
MSPPRTRRQHTAARVYLKGFADTAGQLCGHFRGGTVERRNIRSAGVVRDFYTFADQAGRPDETVERWFAERIEDPIASVLRPLREGQVLRPDWLPALSAFVATSLLRTATVRSLMDQIDEHLRPLLALHYYAVQAGVDLGGLDDAQRRRLLDATAQALDHVPADTDEHRRSQLRTMLRKADEWSALLARWNWDVLHAPDPLLITGDAPVVVMPTRPAGGWAGVLPDDSTVAVPITPTVLVVATPHPLLGAGTLDGALATSVNQGIVRNCHRAVYHRPGTPWPTTLAVPPTPPALPAPTITWRRTDSEARTFPATYPSVADPAVRDLLERLGATDVVD